MPATGLLKVTGADSQWAETIRIAVGFSIAEEMCRNCDVHNSSSSNIGAPWPMYNAGNWVMPTGYSKVVEYSITL